MATGHCANAQVRRGQLRWLGRPPRWGNPGYTWLVASLTGKTAFISAADSSVGRACAEALGDCGAALCLADADSAACAKLAATLGLPAAVAVNLDDRDESSWRAALAHCVSELGGLDLLVLATRAAGSGAAIVDTSLASFQDTLYGGGFAAWLGQKQGVLAMRQTGRGGAIVHVTSVLGVMAATNAAAVCAGAAGTVMSARAAALECAKAADGIVVNTVLTAPVAGDPITGLADADQRLNTVLVEPSDVAAAVLFYATDGAAYMTGTELPVDGGLLCG